MVMDGEVLQELFEKGSELAKKWVEYQELGEPEKERI